MMTLLRETVPKNRYFIITFIVSCVMLTSLIYVVYKQSRVLEKQNQSILHTYETLRQTRRVLTQALDMESSQRGYLLTGMSDFLAPYRDATKELDAQLLLLEDLTTDNDAQQVNIAELKKGAARLKALLRRQISAYQSSSIRGLTLRDMQQSREVMSGVRKSVDTIIKTEMELLDLRTFRSYRERQQYFAILFIGTALALGGLLISNIIIITLIARSRSAHEKLREFEELFQVLMAGIDDGFYEYIPETGRVLFSPSHEKLLGYRPEEMAPHEDTFNRIIHPDDREKTWAVVRQYFNREIPAYSTEFRLRHKDGTYRWILSRGIGQWDANGKIRKLIGTHTDITEQKEREDELRHLNHELEQFTYITSHDLRAPLVNLKGFSGEIELALESARSVFNSGDISLPERQKAELENALNKDIPEALEFIKSSVEKMDLQTSAILDLSRLGKRVMKHEQVDTAAVVKRCVSSLGYEMQQKGIKVEQIDLPIIMADPVAIEQIFGNIIDNAIKYLQPGRPGHIVIKGLELPNEALFSISDNGRGIAPQDTHRVFEIFRRAGNSHDVRGMGMGMAYVKLMLRRMNGRIWFDSTLGEGTTFYFIIPQHKTSER